MKLIYKNSWEDWFYDKRDVGYFEFPKIFHRKSIDKATILNSSVVGEYHKTKHTVRHTLEIEIVLND